MKKTILFDKIHASMLAAAIGDAMGGPIEGWSYERIIKTHGIVYTFLPYNFPPNYHNHFATKAGTVTDDTRLKHIFARPLSSVGIFPGAVTS